MCQCVVGDDGNRVVVNSLGHHAKTMRIFSVEATTMTNWRRTSFTLANGDGDGDGDDHHNSWPGHTQFPKQRKLNGKTHAHQQPRAARVIRQGIEIFMGFRLFPHQCRRRRRRRVRTRKVWFAILFRSSSIYLVLQYNSDEHKPKWTLFKMLQTIQPEMVNTHAQCGRFSSLDNGQWRWRRMDDASCLINFRVYSTHFPSSYKMAEVTGKRKTNGNAVVPNVIDDWNWTVYNFHLMRLVIFRFASIYYAINVLFCAVLCCECTTRVHALDRLRIVWRGE